MSRLAIVTDADRDWALAQKPDWARMHSDDPDLGEIVDHGDWLDGRPTDTRRDPSWFDFVIGEVERFEKFYFGEFKTYAEWSAIWRNSWWPKRREDWKFMSRKNTVHHPYFKRGTPEFDQALRLATAQERLIWDKFGVAQFAPDDKRLKKITAPTLTDRSKAMAGDGA